MTYVAYLFAHDTSDEGFIQCGSFTTDVKWLRYVSIWGGSRSLCWLISAKLRNELVFV
jgi:hypothetical protein